MPNLIIYKVFRSYLILSSHPPSLSSYWLRLLAPAVRGLLTFCAFLTSGCGLHRWQDIRVPASISYHLADIILEELLKLPTVLSPSSDPSLSPSTPSSSLSPPIPLPHLLSPFTALYLHTNSPVTFSRLQSTIFSPLLTDLDSASPSEYAGLIGEGRTAGEVRAGVLKGIFVEAGKEGSRDSNRRKAFAFWKEMGGAEIEDDDEKQ
jgi:ribosomal RNA-processing protein 1